MHCELVVPGLFSADAGGRLAALELLLARGRRSRPGEDKRPEGLEAWLLESFDLEEEPLCAGALTLLAHGGDPGDARWARADPVHLQLMRDRVVFVPGAALSISRDEAQALAAALVRPPRRGSRAAGRLAARDGGPRRRPGVRGRCAAQ
jgi:hypothetical protein